MPIVNKENSTGIVANVLHPVLYLQGAKGEMTVSTDQPEKHLYFKLLNLTAEDFGDPEFKRTYGLRYALYGGSSTDSHIAVALGKAGCMGAYDSNGVEPDVVAREIDNMKSALGEKPFLIQMHSGKNADTQMRLVRLLIEKNVIGVEASGFTYPSAALLCFRLNGIREEDGKIIIPHKIIAGVSREDVLEKFVSPPDPKLVASLLKAGCITAREAALAPRIPVADDITVDAGPNMMSMLPALVAHCNRKQARFGYQQKVRVGAGGVIGTGVGCLAAFEMGAAYVVADPVIRGCADFDLWISGTPFGKTENRPVGDVAMLLLKSCAYHYMKNLLLRIGAAPKDFRDDIL